MDYLEIARARQSCRAYDATRPVEEEKLLTCLEAARLAPSACNAQPYHITVARGATAKAVGAATRSMGMNGFTREAPVFLVISEAAYNQTAGLPFCRHWHCRSLSHRRSPEPSPFLLHLRLV